MDLQSYFNNNSTTTSHSDSAFFDDISTQPATEIPISPTFIESESIPNEVRDFWETPIVEAGVPPILTTPGIMSADDLVS